MLDDAEIAKICHGSIIKAKVYNSSHTDGAGPHYAVVLNSNEQIEKSDTYTCAVISHNTSIEPEFNLPVPSYTGLDGCIICSWVTKIDLPGVTEVRRKIQPVEMLKILETVRKADDAKRAASKKKRSKR